MYVHTVPPAPSESRWLSGAVMSGWVGVGGGFPKVRTTSEHSRVLADILKVG